MRYLYSLLLVATIIVWSSCRNDFETVPSNGKLEFSKDTVYLDTVFSNIGSSTYTLKVYNRSKEDINIPTIKLGNGESSHYRLNVDGVAGKTFRDVEIMAKDSIFIFIESTIDINTFTNDTQFLYTDIIEFDSGSNWQKVDLVTLVQDAVFLYPERFADGTTETLTLGSGEDAVDIYGFFLDDKELHFTNEKPYVIYGYAAIPGNKTLTIDAGARVHFHEASGIIAANQSTIKVNGSLSSNPEILENEVIFQGDRLEPGFENTPGQWGMIWLTSGSKAHEFHYTTIKNGTVGILTDDNDGSSIPTVTLKNTKIHNSAINGILATNSHIYAENLLIANTGKESFLCTFGGKYNFNHSTFANYWRYSFRNSPTVSIQNYIQVNTTDVQVGDLTEANFTNCIIYGNEQREFAVSGYNEGLLNFNLKNSLVKLEDPQGTLSGNPLYDFSNAAYYTHITFNKDPQFFNIEKNQYQISHESGANGIGDINTGQLVPVDLIGTPRTQPYDAGAYESAALPKP